MPYIQTFCWIYPSNEMSAKAFRIDRANWAIILVEIQHWHE